MLKEMGTRFIIKYDKLVSCRLKYFMLKRGYIRGYIVTEVF